MSKARQESFRTEEAHVCCCCETHVEFVFCAEPLQIGHLEERANTFVSSINQHDCPLVLQEVELALFFEVRIQHFCQAVQGCMEPAAAPDLSHGTFELL